MKILFIHPSVELYGADKILLYILDILHSKNEITVLLPKEGILVNKIKEISQSIKIVVNEELPIVHSKLGIKDYFQIPFRLKKFFKLFHKNEFDLVYCNTLATVLLLFTNWSKKKVVHVHEIISNKFLNFGFSVLIRLNTKNVICVSEHVKDNLLFSKKYKTIHNGIPDNAGFYRENIISDKIIFSLPGRFMPQKGQWFVIEALKELSETELNKIEIRMFGSPPPNRIFLGEELRNLIKKYKLENFVKLFDFTQNISEIYEQANIILVPSMMSDPFPTTVLEALEFSRPVISTNHGGASEILDSSCSVLINPGNKEELASAIRFFINNNSLIKEYSLNARNKYERKLSLETFREKLLNYLEKNK